jgi:hypothetical protein
VLEPVCFHDEQGLIKSSIAIATSIQNSKSNKKSSPHSHQTIGVKVKNTKLTTPNISGENHRNQRTNIEHEHTSITTTTIQHTNLNKNVTMNKKIAKIMKQETMNA